jgi:hypothetical protein
MQKADASTENALLLVKLQLCSEHGISKDGMLEDFATQVSA